MLNIPDLLGEMWVQDFHEVLPTHIKSRKRERKVKRAEVQIDINKGSEDVN